MLVTSEKNFHLAPWSPWWLKGCPRLGLIPALCLCSVLGSWSLYGWLPKFSLENLLVPFPTLKRSPNRCCALYYVQRALWSPISSWLLWTYVLLVFFPAYGLNPKLWTCESSQTGAPLRPIVSSIGSVTYELACVVADILSPLIGNTVHHILNTQTFVEEVKDLKLHPDESLVSFDVTALFTSIPVNDTLEVIKEILEKDNSWKKGLAEQLSVENVVHLLSCCLNTTYFVFREQFYQQRDGCAIGSPCSLLCANA